MNFGCLLSMFFLVQYLPGVMCPSDSCLGMLSIHNPSMNLEILILHGDISEWESKLMTMGSGGVEVLTV